MNINLRIEKIANGFVVRADAESLGYELSRQNVRYFSDEAEMNAALGDMISQRIKQAEDWQAEARRQVNVTAQFQRSIGDGY